MNFHSKNFWPALSIGLLALALNACTPMQTAASGATASTGTTSVAVTLTSASIISGQRTTATATVSNSVSGPVASTQVCFTTDSLATVQPAAPANCVTTAANGVATIQIEGGANSGSGVVTATVGSTKGTANYTVKGPSLVLSGGPLTISASNSASATATVVDGNGDAIPGAVVTFSLGDSTFAKLNPSSGTVLADSAGKAAITLDSGTASGASTLTAKADIAVKSATTNLIIGTASLSDQINFQSSTSNNPVSNAIKLSALTLGTSSSLSAYGTTSVSVTVLNSDNSVYTTPVEVNFTSNCVAANPSKASISASVLTINGVATTSFVDKGCGSTDTIQASLSGVSAAAVVKNLVILAPAIGSIQFVKATPTNISLKGTGGAGRQETSAVTFKVVDEANNPKAADVTFALSTNTGGIALSTLSAKSDAITGEVSTIVQAGTIATPVRVTASVVAGGSTLTTQSDQLTISTGLPDQAHFSMSATAHNIEGWRIDGATANLTVRLADHFGNPVPKGTAVSFVTEGAKVQSNCTTDIDGGCSVLFTSQNLRPANGRITVSAYAIGEETFTDSYLGEGYATLDSERVDANGNATDMSEAFRDDNENGVRDANEPFSDFNNDGQYTSADGKLNSTLCKGSICGVSPTIHVRSQAEGGAPFVMVLADSVAALKDVSAVSDLGAVIPSPTSLDLEGCFGGNLGRTYSLTFTVGSEYSKNLPVFNPMPAGTTVTVLASDDGRVVGNNVWTVGDTLNATTYTARVTTDVTSCSSPDATKNGVLSIKVKTPGANGVASTETIFFIDLKN